MAIPSSELVNIVPRVLSGTGKDLNFNGLILTESKILSSNTIFNFGSALEVAETFGQQSDEYVMAVHYFNGFNNSDVKPSNLMYYRVCLEDTAPFIRGSEIGDPSDALTKLKAIGDGSLVMTLGESQSATGINLSSCNSLSDVASTIQEKLQALSTGGFTSCTVEYSSLLNAFTITAGTKGADVAISYATGNIADALNLVEGQAILSKGVTAVTKGSKYADALDHVVKISQNFVTFSTVTKQTEEEVIGLAQWANTQFNAGNQFLYIYHDDNVNLKDSSKSDTIADKLKALNLNGVAGVYGAPKYGAFVMGACASIAWEKANSTITLAFKSQSGLGANVEDRADARALDDKLMNYVGNYASRNDNFILFQKGAMFGVWSWIDTYLNSTWLNNALQVQILAGFESAKRVPFNDRGYALVRAWCRDVINRAINNGVIDKGVSLSETQKTQIMLEVGEDISSELYSNGYYLKVIDATAQTRQQRSSPDCALYYTYGGSVQRLNLPSIAIV